MRLLGGEVLKLVRRPATYITLGILLALLVVIFVTVGASYSTITKLPAEQGGGTQTETAIRTLLTFPGAYDAIVSFLASLGGLFAAAYGAAAAGGDWGWGMVKVAVARGESRSRYVVAKLAAVVVLLAPGLLIAFAVGIVAVALGATIAGFSLSGIGDAPTLGTLPWLVVRGWLALAEQAAIGFAVATVARSQIAGLAAAIGVYFVEQFAASFWPEYIRYFPFSVVSSLLRDPASAAVLGGAANRYVIDQNLALGLVIVYMAASAGVAALFLERVDITG